MKTMLSGVRPSAGAATSSNSLSLEISTRPAASDFAAPEDGRTPAVPRGPSPAFTLLELLVVIAIIGVLSALILPVLGRVKESGRGAACLSNLHQIGVAL